MARRPGARGVPRAYVTPDGTWPAGPFSADAPPEVIYAATIAARLTEGLEQAHLTRQAAADQLGLARPSLHRILAGMVMPDLRSLAAAEVLLGRRLTPDPVTVAPGAPVPETGVDGAR